MTQHFFSDRGNVKFPKLNCRIIGLRSVKGLDGVDFMLNKPAVTLEYLVSGDALEALWLDLNAHSTSVRCSFKYSRFLFYYLYSSLG